MDVVAGQFGAWTPIGVEQTASGYQVAWKLTGVDQYIVWNTDSSGNQTSQTAFMTGASTALQSFETSFHQDLNGDGAIGIHRTVIGSAGSTNLAAVGSKFFLEAALSGKAPEIFPGGHSTMADIANDQMPPPRMSGFDRHLALEMGHYQMPATAQIEQHLHHPVIM